jgi:hypothetical protein
MAARRKPIPLRKDEDKLLRKLYKQWRIPRGQYKKHPDYLAAFTEMFNRLSGNSYDPVQIYHYIETQQKITARLDEPWPTFDGAHKVLPPVETVLNEAHLLVLRQLWIEHVIPLGLGTDAAANRADIVEMIAREFTRLTGLRVPGMLLAMIAETKRKRGEWPRLKDYGDDDIGFDDLDKIG